MNKIVRTGLERIIEDDDIGNAFSGMRIGLLANQASTDRGYHYSKDCFADHFGSQLTCLFSPQHGFFSEKQDNMIESDHEKDAITEIPIFSLYGETRKPTQEMFDKLDVLFIDLVDVGTRVYTFMYTMAYCLEAAKKYDKKIVVLDRPNPIGGKQLEGNILNTEYASFVGLYPIPMRHGLTFGELALYINGEHGIDADLEIITMEGWSREMYFDETELPWVSPSPNMPTSETAIVYPGQVIWEGTNISEGRGTTLPFELFGAPFWEHDVILDHLKTVELPGVYLRSLVFEPTSGKWAGQTCTGFQLHITNRQEYKPYRTSLALLQATLLNYPDDFCYKEPPYEYEYEKNPMDLILGDKRLRKELEAGVAIHILEEEWLPSLVEFEKTRKKYLLYL